MLARRGWAELPVEPSRPLAGARLAGRGPSWQLGVVGRAFGQLRARWCACWSCVCRAKLASLSRWSLTVRRLGVAGGVGGGAARRVVGLCWACSLLAAGPAWSRADAAGQARGLTWSVRRSPALTVKCEKVDSPGIEPATFSFQLRSLDHYTTAEIISLVFLISSLGPGAVRQAVGPSPYPARRGRGAVS